MEDRKSHKQQSRSLLMRLFSFQVQGLKLDDFARGKLDITTKELLEEKEEAMAVCNAAWLDESKLW